MCTVHVLPLGITYIHDNQISCFSHIVLWKFHCNATMSGVASACIIILLPHTLLCARSSVVDILFSLSLSPSPGALEEHYDGVIRTNSQQKLTLSRLQSQYDDQRKLCSSLRSDYDKVADEVSQWADSHRSSTNALIEKIK